MFSRTITIEEPYLQCLDDLEIGNSRDVRMLLEVEVLLGNGDSFVEEVLVDGFSVLTRNQHTDRKFCKEMYAGSDLN